MPAKSRRHTHHSLALTMTYNCFLWWLHMLELALPGSSHLRAIFALIRKLSHDARRLDGMGMHCHHNQSARHK